MLGDAFLPSLTRRGILSAAACFLAAPNLARAVPETRPAWLQYETRLGSRLRDAGGGAFALDFAHQLLQEANALRGREQLPAYTWDEDLAKCARAHAADMAGRHYFAHKSPEGFTHLDRVALMTRTFCGVTSENLAWRDYPGQASEPAEFEQLWENSPPHRANLLRADYQSAGYGVVTVGTEYYAAGVYSNTVVKLNESLALRFEQPPDLGKNVRGASPAFEYFSVTQPFEPPTSMIAVDGRMPVLAPGAWQLRPMTPVAKERFKVVTGPMFFVD
jgi:uncharacterized protein YkwD